MEADRYKQNHKLFIFCMICLLMSLTLFGLSLFILPHFIWGWHYNVPGFVFDLTEWLIEYHSFTSAGAKIMVFLIVFIPALITGFISYITSNYIENKVLDIHEEKNTDEINAPLELKETFSLSMKILLLIVLVVIVMFLVQWLITVPVTPQE